MSRRAAASLVGLVLALPLASWWDVGVLSEPGKRQYPDFMVEPPRLSSNQQLLVGLVAPFAGAAVVVAAFRLRSLRPDQAGKGTARV